MVAECRVVWACPVEQRGPPPPIYGNNARVPDPRDEFTLLCERCGYVIDDLPRDGPCPECGTPIAESLPERRVGSAWQQRPSAEAWIRTSIALLRHPVEAYAGMRVEGWQSYRFAWWNLRLAGVLVAAALAADAVLRVAPTHPAFIWWFFATITGSVITVIAFSILTRIEHVGIRFFGRRRGWRVTRLVADVVCWHSSIAWVLAALLCAAGLLVMHTDAGEVFGPGVQRAWNQYRGLMPLLGLLIGLLVFEFLVYFGVRRNRFANRSRPGR